VHRRVIGLRCNAAVIQPHSSLKPRSHQAQRHRLDRLEPLPLEFGLALFGQWVRDGRRQAGLSQRQLERLSGVDQTTISRLERGLMPRLGLDRLAAVCGALARELGHRPGDRFPFRFGTR